MIVRNPNFVKKNFPHLKDNGFSLGGLGDIFSNINPTTIWTPTTGFLASPGVVTPTDINAGTSTYQAPSLLGPPACAFGPTMDTSECQAQVQANQQHDLGLRNLSNYNVDLYNCLNTFPQPTDCNQRTFGLTPVGGFTGGVNTLTPNAQQFVTGVNPVTGSYVAPTPNASISNSVQNTQSQTTQQKVMNSNGGVVTIGGQDLSSIGTALSQTESIAGFNIPIWALGLAAVGAIIVATRH